MFCEYQKFKTRARSGRQPLRLGSVALNSLSSRRGAAQSCIELVIANRQPSGSRPMRRKPPRDCANNRRGMLYGPSDFFIASFETGDQFTSERRINRRAENVPGLVQGCQWVRISGGRGLAGRASSSFGGGIIHRASSGESSQSLSAQSSCPLPAARELPDAFDGFARTRIRGSVRLKQRQHPHGAISRPAADKAEVILGQPHHIVREGSAGPPIEESLIVSAIWG